MVALNNGEAAIIGDSVGAVLWLFFGKNVTEHGPWHQWTPVDSNVAGLQWTHWLDWTLVLKIWVQSTYYVVCLECNGSLSEITVSGSAEEGLRVEEYMESVESESELRKTTMVD